MMRLMKAEGRQAVEGGEWLMAVGWSGRMAELAQEIIVSEGMRK